MSLKLSDYKFDRKFNILVIGDPGTGKTTLAASAPGRKYIFAFEDGVTSVAKIPAARESVEYDLFLPKPHLPIALTEAAKAKQRHYPGQSWTQAMTRLQELSVNCPYDVVIVDSLTSMSQVCWENILTELNMLNAPPRAESRTAYGTLGIRCLQFFYGIIGLPCATICIGHESYERNEETGQFQYRISAEGRMFSDRLSSGKDFGEIWRTVILPTKDNQRVYKIDTAGNDKFPAKSRWGCFLPYEDLSIAAMLEKVQEKFGAAALRIEEIKP